MEANPRNRRLVLAADVPPPELTLDAAVVLIRTLRKERGKQAATDDGRSVTDDQAVA
jgi:hypothetical protein